MWKILKALLAFWLIMVIIKLGIILVVLCFLNKHGIDMDYLLTLLKAYGIIFI